MIELRREGLSVYEISTRLRAEDTPLNRTGVGQILAEEGVGRLLGGTAPEASASPATPAGTRTCPGPRSSTSPPSPTAPKRAWPACCRPSPT